MDMVVPVRRGELESRVSLRTAVDLEKDCAAVLFWLCQSSDPAAFASKLNLGGLNEAIDIRDAALPC